MNWTPLVALLLLFTNVLIFYGGEEILTYYVLNPPFCWEAILIGFFKAWDYIVESIGCIIIIRWVKGA